MPAPEAHPIHTIGHSTRSLVEFVELLKLGGVKRVVDIRSVPRSRTNPQFNLDVLPGQLASWQIGYTHVSELGGLRGKSKTVAAEINAFWVNQSFHNYADYALGEPFHFGFTRLRTLGVERRCAIMCAETVWWRCHRRFITDYLIAAGETVFHILGKNHVEPAKINVAAELGPAGSLTYPATPPTEVGRSQP